MHKRYEDRDQIAALFQRLYKTEDFKDVVSILNRLYKDPALVPNAAVDGVALGKFTDIRIGEYNVCRFIESMINREIGKDKE